MSQPMTSSSMSQPMTSSMSQPMTSSSMSQPMTSSMSQPMTSSMSQSMTSSSMSQPMTSSIGLDDDDDEVRFEGQVFNTPAKVDDVMSAKRNQVKRQLLVNEGSQSFSNNRTTPMNGQTMDNVHSNNQMKGQTMDNVHSNNQMNGQTMGNVYSNNQMNGQTMDNVHFNNQMNGHTMDNAHFNKTNHQMSKRFLDAVIIEKKNPVKRQLLNDDPNLNNVTISQTNSIARQALEGLNISKTFSINRQSLSGVTITRANSSQSINDVNLIKTDPMNKNNNNNSNKNKNNNNNNSNNNNIKTDRMNSSNQTLNDVSKDLNTSFSFVTPIKNKHNNNNKNNNNKRRSLSSTTAYLNEGKKTKKDLKDLNDFVEGKKAKKELKDLSSFVEVVLEEEVIECQVCQKRFEKKIQLLEHFCKKLEFSTPVKIKVEENKTDSPNTKGNGFFFN
jgi:hypothetical protein